MGYVLEGNSLFSCHDLWVCRHSWVSTDSLSLLFVVLLWLFEKDSDVVLYGNPSLRPDVRESSIPCFLYYSWKEDIIYIKKINWPIRNWEIEKVKSGILKTGSEGLWVKVVNTNRRIKMQGSFLPFIWAPGSCRCVVNEDENEREREWKICSWHKRQRPKNETEFV